MSTHSLAPFAAGGERWTARVHDEPPSTNRSPFQRDRDRIVHCTAFRRLKHKTQVFVAPEGDHYRTRLTHSLEVSQIGRAIARTVGLDEDLTEALALAHDLGHPPFGHAGEQALAEAMAPFGGFDHNAQTLRVVTRLEQRYPAFDGLNLTLATLDGLVKHNGPVREEELPFGLAALIEEARLIPTRFASAEAQVASLADDIAYGTHDIDDGLRAGLFPLAALRPVPLVGDVLGEVMRQYAGLEEKQLVHETVRRLIGLMVDDLLLESRRRLRVRKPESLEDIAASGEAVIAFSPAMRANIRGLKDFLSEHMYRHHRVNGMMSKVKRVVAELFALYLAEPDVLPPGVSRHCADKGSPEAARAIADFIAGMTDTFALAEHRRLFDPEVRT